MHKLILFIKSFRRDFDPVKKLIASIELYNRDHLPVYLSVNDSDFDYFADNLNHKNINLIKTVIFLNTQIMMVGDINRL
jgi:hypothetical protein